MDHLSLDHLSLDPLSLDHLSIYPRLSVCRSEATSR